MTKIGKYIVGCIIIILCFYYIFSKPEYNNLIHQLDVWDLCYSLIVACMAMIINGMLLFYIIKKQNNIQIKLIDYALLPIMMHLWSYILPTQGGLIFSTFFLQRKYGLRPSKGYSYGVYTLIILLVITGFIGLVFSYIYRFDALLFIIACIFLVLTPLFIFVFRKVVGLLTFRHRLLIKLKAVVGNIIETLAELLRQPRTNLVITSFTLLNAFVFAIWYYIAVRALHLELSFFQVVIMSAISRLTILVRILPGNIGVQEIITAAGLSIVGGAFDDGVLISLFVRFTSLSIALVLGVYGMISNRNYFKLKELIDIVYKQKKTDTA